jgi:hypothetical protein
MLSIAFLPESDEIEIGWAGELGATYQLQSRPHLVEGVWTDVGDPVTGVEGEQSLTIPISGSDMSLFRVVQVD